MATKKKNIPKIKNLVREKMLKYSAGVIYLLALSAAVTDHYGMFFVLALLAAGLGIAAFVFGILFILDNT